MQIHKLLHSADRLRRMGRGEIADRCRQELSKRYDGARGWLGHDFAANVRGESPLGSVHFFFDHASVEAVLSLIRERIPERAEQIIQEAEQIRQHRFDLLGYQSLDYDSPTGNIDWHWDAVHCRRAPSRTFYRIRYLDFEECGDAKIIWELNRHQHFVTLAKAFRLSGNLRYVDEILRQWRHWRAENPYPVGINWSSSLEVAIRSLSWLWTYHLLKGSSGVYDFRKEWLRGFALHGYHIERYLSTYFSPNTHLLGEGAGLFFLGVLCPELTAADRWKALGWEIILRESEKQIDTDGFHFEQSTYYHAYALDFLLHAVVLATVNDVKVPQCLETKIEHMLSALSMMGRFGPPPGFGDDDGGRLFDPRRNRTEHLLDPLATGAIVYQRRDFKAIARGLREETLWLLGEEGVRQWDRLEATPLANKSVALRKSGYYALASAEAQLVVKCGPMGAHSAGHSHADALNACLQSHGHPLLIDCGTFEYVGPGDDREKFRGTGVHNTVCLDGVSQAQPTAAFSWRTITQTKVDRWIPGKNFDLLAASHNGYCSLPEPVVHRRWIVSLRNGAYLVRDVLEGTGRHHIDIAWHLAPGLELAEEGFFRTQDFRTGVFFLGVPDSGWSNEVREEPYSPAYGEKVPIKVMHFSNDVAMPAEFTVFLQTTAAVGRAASSLRRCDGIVGHVSGYEYQENGQSYSFLFNESGGGYDYGALSSDAEFVSHRRGAGGEDGQLIMGRGSYVRVDGGPELRCSRLVEWAELCLENGKPVVFSSHPHAVSNLATGESANLGVHQL